MRTVKQVFLYVMLMLLAPAVAQQLPANVIQLAQSELLRRGLDESEVRMRLLSEGIDIDNMSPAQYAASQPRIIAILDELENAKKVGTVTAVLPASNATTQPPNRQSGPGTPAAATVQPMQESKTPASVLPANVRPGTTRQSIAAGKHRTTRPDANNNFISGLSDFEITDSIPEEKIDSARWNTPIYGHNLFTNNTFDVISSIDARQVPDTYILGEGDVIHISIFGASQTNIQQRVATDGSIKPTNAARIFVKGLSLLQARSLIRESLSKSYLFRDDQLALSVVTTRTVLVNVLGETNKTGGYYLSAVNSALNALSAAGGPTNIGSVRNIQLIRGTTRRPIDLYEFMNDPVLHFRMDLQNNDILFVPPIGNVVLVEGAVKRPMRYEMLPTETLADLIRYSGGLAMNAKPDYVQVQRFTAGEEKLFEWNLADVMTGTVKVLLRDGDIVRIHTVKQPMENFVEVEGSVHFPGRFYLGENTTLGQVLAKARINTHARNDIIFIERRNADNTIDLLSVPNHGDDNSFPLNARDKIKVLEMADFAASDTVYVRGEVNKPFKKVLSVNNRISVREAIELAGGLKPSVYPVAYIFRKRIENPQRMNYIRVDLKKDTHLLLQPGDSLNIYDNGTFTNVGQLSISGAVKNPKTLTFDSSLSLKDLIINAGGFNIGAAYNRIEVFRVTLSQTEKTSLRMVTLHVDSLYNLISPADFTLQPFDHVVVRNTPDFTLGRTMEINGQVRYPGVYVLESKETTLADVIDMAGGLLNDADPNGVQLFRTFKNRGEIIVSLNRALRNRRSRNNNPILFEGDVVNINRIENTVTILSEGTRIAQYTVGKGVEDSLKTVIYQGAKTAAWYVKNYAGGFQRNVDRRSVSVTYPNNQMQSTKSFLFFKMYPRVEPGSVISMKMDAEKIAKEATPREKVDLERTLSTGLSTLMSTLSIVLLLRQF